MYARPLIDSLDFARNGRKISGEVPFAGLPRLLDLLQDTQGTLSYTIHGGLDELGNPLLEVSTTGSCRLRCQRCLGGMEYPLRLDERLLLRDQAGLDALEDDEDEFDSILAEAHLDVLNLLEEEILLSLPISPRHEPGDCQATVADKETKAGNPQGSGEPEEPATHEEEKNPFAVLAKLKRSN